MIFCSIAFLAVGVLSALLGFSRPAFYYSCLGLAGGLLLFSIVRGLITRASVTALLYRDPVDPAPSRMSPGGDRIPNRL